MVIRHHSQIGHLYVPNLKARLPNELGGFYVRTNSLGFRSNVEFDKPKRDKARILFFGDSFTAGDGCSNEERFSDLIGQELGVETYNFGLSGSGTDQQCLILEQFAGKIEADLIVFCVCVENIERIKVGFREAIDRQTGKRVLVPKPYFLLENDHLELNHVPVPTDRPDLERVDPTAFQPKIPHKERWAYRSLNAYRHDPRLEWARRMIRSGFPDLRSKMLQWGGYQPYEDYKNEQSRGWQLMRAILNRFCSAASPVPVLLVPLPTFHFFFDEVEPIYQKRYAALSDPRHDVHVMNLTSPLLELSREERGQLRFRHDYHFSPLGNRRVAEIISEEIRSKGLLPEPSRTGARDEQTRTASRTAVSAPRRPTYVLGLSCFYHNSAASLIKDGKIVAAAEEERFSRLKNDRRFPHNAVNYCLEEGGIQQDDLAAVVYYDNAPLTFERIMHTMVAVAPDGEQAWQRVMPSWVRYKLRIPSLIRRYLHYGGLILHEFHHRSHAASAFFPSPFKRAAVLTIDGVGEWATASIGLGAENQLKMLKEMRFPHSLGMLYSAFTQFTGFKVNSGEYKMMGLAPYGEPKYVDLIYDRLIDLKSDGSVELNLDYFAYLSEPRTTNEKFAELFGGPPRAPESMITEREMDIARSIQAVTEEAILRMARYAHNLTGEKNLCLAGGVALNCVANGRLLREGPFEDIWIQPAAGDAGGALGAALDAYHTYFEGPREKNQESGRPLQGGSYWGPGFSSDEVRAYLETNGYPYKVVSEPERSKRVAASLEEGKVVGHFSGRAEFGPRALGSRSILGDARNSEMQVNLNLKIKYRESFRPFAPSILSERVSDFFELDRESPYMMLVAPVKAELRKPFALERGDGNLLNVVKQDRSQIPAVTHVDYSARVQTITPQDHPAYYDLIKAFERLTGYPVIVNTSFNVRGEPIVSTPQDAYRCFMRTEMDVLVLEDCVLLKQDQPEWPEPKGHVENDDLPEPVRKADEELANAIGAIYREEFLPVATRLKAEGKGQISTKFVRNDTLWRDFEADQSPATIFPIPEQLDVEHLDPEAAANAVTEFWAPGVARDLLRPVVAKLLVLNSRYPMVDSPDIQEQVSDFVYVLY